MSDQRSGDKVDRPATTSSLGLPQKPIRQDADADRRDNERRPEIERKGDALPRNAGKRLRILVVEDNRDAADSLRQLLELYGYEAMASYSGPDGVRAAEQLRPDLVLCDIGLPGLDGYGVAKTLRQNPSTAKARLIAVTAYGRDEDRRRSHEAGFDRHLVKPVDLVTLQAVLLQELSA
jgi:CheY-like chemotaxis protein